MWICKQCGEKIDDQFDSCWKCATPKAGLPADAPENQSGGSTDKKSWRLAYKYFRGTLATWDDLFDEAAQFATEVGSERVVGLSHSSDRGNGVVVVWYWTQTGESKAA